MNPDRRHPPGSGAPDATVDDHAFLIRLANTRMPFGKYRGRLLIDLPERYVLWFRSQGYPAGDLGIMIASLYEIKANGLEGLLRPLVGNSDQKF
ncbi:MAG: DUF3820 family protein [Alkalispirochaeta sp.]